MNAVYFIEKNGVKYYKCDTFWSKSDKIENAKIHNDSENDQERFLKSLLYSLDRGDVRGDVSEDIINFFQDTKYGYRKFKESEVDGFSLKKDAQISEPIYLKYITNVSKDGYDIIDYKQILRDEKINKIMKK